MQYQLFIVAALLLIFSIYRVTSSEVSTDVLVDSRIPEQCNSPGWEEAPYDISAVLGSYVFFNCKSSITHSTIMWLHEGREDVMATEYASKAMIYHGNSSLRYGPIEDDDNGLALGCEVTTEYGVLPSALGRITLESQPSYSPSKTQVAIIGQPFDFDFNYTCTKPPLSYEWFRNGQPFKGEEDRVTLDHEGIVFSRVLQEDSGQYKVVARNEAGETQAHSVLKVVYWFTASHVQTGSNSRPTLSSKLAVSLTLDQKRKENKAPVMVGKSGAFHISNPDSTTYAMQVIRTLLNKASEEAMEQGTARLLSEKIYRQVLQLVGLHYNNDTFTKESLKKINDFTNCTKAQKSFNCITNDVLKYRTIDGTCNNFFYPLNGAALTPFARLIPAEYEDGISLPVGHLQADPFSPPWPSPRLVSWKIVKSLQIPQMVGMTHMFMQWGQFLDHDLDIAPVFSEVECGCNYTEECLPIPVQEDDAFFGVNTTHGGMCLSFVRSIPACKYGTVEESLPRNQINQLTAYIDASNVYGSDKKLANSLRLFRGGLLKQGGRLNSFKGNLPFQEEKPAVGDVPFFVGGDERVNEQIALTVMHTIWMREHNRIARKLADINPCWSDEKLYQETRKIVGAEMQVISYNEFLPVLFGTHFETYVRPYRGYNPYIDASIPNSFAAAAYRFGHSLVRPQLLRLDKDFRRLDIGPLPLERAFFNPIVYFESGGTDPLLRGLLVDQSNPVDEFLNRVLTSKLFAESPERLGTDLASLNIQRGRDHGLPSYRTWQRFCERVFPGKIATFRHDDTKDKLIELYGEDGYRNGIDFWVGGLAEESLPGALVGPTFACTLGITFSRLRDGDRFWYDNPYVFTPAQRFEIKRTSLAKVICTNADDIPEIQRSVFRVDGSRVPCSSIPEINLWKWWDRRCYYQYYYGRPYGYY